jgi:hypothetical protein
MFCDVTVAQNIRITTRCYGPTTWAAYTHCLPQGGRRVYSYILVASACLCYSTLNKHSLFSLLFLQGGRQVYAELLFNVLYHAERWADHHSDQAKAPIKVSETSHICDCMACVTLAAAGLVVEVRPPSFVRS